MCFLLALRAMSGLTGLCVLGTDSLAREGLVWGIRRVWAPGLHQLPLWAPLFFGVFYLFWLLVSSILSP